MIKLAATIAAITTEMITAAAVGKGSDFATFDKLIEKLIVCEEPVFPLESLA